MTKEDLKQYVEALTSKKDELQGYVEQRLRHITYPASTVTMPKTKANPPYLNFLGVGVGLALLAIGVGTKTHAVTIGGGIVTAAGLYTLSKKRLKESNAVTPPTDYSQLTKRIYDEIKAIHVFVSDGWEHFLADQRDSLKQQIASSRFDAELKDKLMAQAIRRSVVQHSMMEVLGDLSMVEKKQDVAAYKQYVGAFLAKYKRAIDEAYNEQKQRYETMAQLIK